MSVRARRLRQVSVITATALVATVALAYGEAQSAAPAHADGSLVSLVWEHTMSTGETLGSAGVGDLDGDGTSVIVGDVNGHIYAWHTSDGTEVSGWPYQADSSIYSTPAVSGSGSSARVYVGVGTSAHPTHGGYLKLNASGSKMWEVHASLLPGGRGGSRGVMASLAVGPIQTSQDVVGGAMGQMQLAINTATGKTLPGFPWLMADTNFSSPALADLNGTGHDYIVEGGDSTKGVADLENYGNGGHIRILRYKGSQGSKYPNGGLHCQYLTNQVVQSSPAVGNFLGTGTETGVVVGTGTFYHGASDTDKLIAINTSCKRIWKFTMDGNSLSSPALADVDGDPNTTPDVVELSEKGTLYDIDGADGTLRWSIPFGGTARGSVTTFQSPTDASQYILVPTSHGVYLVNGLTHAYQQITSLSSNSAATVTADPNGLIGITVVASGGQVLHYQFNGDYSVTTVETAGAWPMFHRDPQLDGFAGDLPPAPLDSQLSGGNGSATGKTPTPSGRLN